MSKQPRHTALDVGRLPVANLQHAWKKLLHQRLECLALCISPVVSEVVISGVLEKLEETERGPRFSWASLFSGWISAYMAQ